MEDEIELIDADFAYEHLLGKQIHVEFELDGSISVLDGGEEVCTHITEEELSNLQNKKKEEEIENQKKILYEWIQKKIEDWLNQWLIENCGKC